MKGLIPVLLLVMSSLAFSANEGYLVDSNNNIVKSGSGLCWRTGYWTPANAVEGCDPVAKPAVVSSKVSIQAETLFDFNQSKIKPSGVTALNGVVDSLKGVNYEIVTVIGYTDRIGSTNYNKTLSENRAESVRRYLISQGVKSDRIVTEGRGKANPVSTCVGNKVTEALIKCLQPDRRVVIDIIGIR